MSVIVLGMEMPENCHECRLCMQEADTELGVCAYCGLTGFGWEAYSDRPDWCPLHPLPEKHGRLIDADAVVDKLWSLQETYQMLDDTRTADKIIHGIFRAKQALIEAPTIVEAEGD